MKNQVFANLSIAFIIALVCGISTTSLYSQTSDKDVSHEDERLVVDAYALAYGICKAQIALYESEQNPTNTMLSRVSKEATVVRNTFSVNINYKYKYEADEGQLEKFNRKVKAATKQLPTCIRYQSLLDANANIEKGKAEKSQ